MKTPSFPIAVVLVSAALCCGTGFAQTIDPCTRPLDEKAATVDVLGQHRYQVNTRDVAWDDLPGTITRLSAHGVRYVYIIPEAEATYTDVQSLTDRLLGSVGKQISIAYLQPPREGSDTFRCALATRSIPSRTLLRKIPK